MVQALVVVLHSGHALLLARIVVFGGVHNIAGEQFLPEGEAPRRACGGGQRGGAVARIGCARCGNLGIGAPSPPFKPYPDAMVGCVEAWAGCKVGGLLQEWSRMSSATMLGARPASNWNWQMLGTRASHRFLAGRASHSLPRNSRVSSTLGRNLPRTRRLTAYTREVTSHTPNNKRCSISRVSAFSCAAMSLGSIVFYFLTCQTVRHFMYLTLYYYITHGMYVMCNYLLYDPSWVAGHHDPSLQGDPVAGTRNPQRGACVGECARQAIHFSCCIAVSMCQSVKFTSAAQRPDSSWLPSSGFHASCSGAAPVPLVHYTSTRHLRVENEPRHPPLTGTAAMALLLSPAKLVLLAVHCAVRADLASLAALAARHGAALRKDLLLRILLTYLPETVPSSQYAPFLQQLESGAFPDADGHDVDCSPVERLAEDEAAKKVRKLRLLPLAVPAAPDEPEHDTQDATALFLLRRSYRVDEEAGLLAELPGLLLPFLDHSPCMRTLLVSTILPLLRRNCEYYPHEPVPHTLHEFRQLPDRLAATLLLSQTGARKDDLPYVGRDLRGLVGPWLSDERRWKHGKNATSSPGDTPPPDADECEAEVVCPGWDEVLRWLAAQASKRWVVAVNAVRQWNGPRDVDLAGWGAVELSDGQWDYLEQSYARAALASAYLLPEPSIEALEGAYAIVAKISSLRHLGSVSPLASALAVLPPLTDLIPDEITSARNATYMRNHLLRPSNVLTAPTAESTAFLQALILSAHILTRAGCPCTVRRAGELALLQDEREQMAEAVKLIRSVSNNGPKTDDKFWVKFRNDVLWLRDWGAEDGWSSTETAPRGVFGQLKRDFLEAEILKVLLSNTRKSGVNLVLLS